jgi:hypothetical protein
MAATFDASLSTDKDWVRALIGDMDTGNAYLQDETIEAILTEEQNKYVAASRACRIIYMNLTGGGTLEDRKVGETRIRYQAAQRFKQTADELKARGSAYIMPWSGGIYKTDRDARDDDADKLGIDIARNMTDNPRSPTDLTNTTT